MPAVVPQALPLVFIVAMVLEGVSVVVWLHDSPTSPNTLNRALGAYCEPNKPAPPAADAVVFTVTSGIVACAGWEIFTVELVRLYMNRGLKYVRTLSYFRR
jgi:hypothetical protein